MNGGVFETGQAVEDFRLNGFNPGNPNHKHDGLDYLRDTFLNKSCHIFPGDSYSYRKVGICLDISKVGIVFELTEIGHDCRNMAIGQKIFYSFDKLQFALEEV